MSEYREYKFKQIDTTNIFTVLAKDVIEAQEQIADMYNIPYKDLIEI